MLPKATFLQGLQLMHFPVTLITNVVSFICFYFVFTEDQEGERWTIADLTRDPHTKSTYLSK